MDKFKRQESQYSFPYHHIPYIDADGSVKRIRVLPWGWEYMCYQLHVQTIVKQLNPKSVLEVGCGDGFFVGNLGNHIKRRVGVDLSERAISYAKAFYPEVCFHSIDVNELDETFDVVAAIEVLEHIPDDLVSTFIKNIAERTTQNGLIILSVPTDVQPLHKKHFRHYNRELLEYHMQESSAGLKLVKLEYVYKENLWLKTFLKLTCNKFWLCEIEQVRKIVWHYIWNYARHANCKNGYHLIATLCKV